MEDSNKEALSKSSSNHSSSGNNENESENQRNLHQKNKNFMSPTISAASKFSTTPNKKMIFTEWKSPKSDLHKLGNSNSGTRKSLPKIPSFSSPKNVVHSHKINDEHDDAAFVPDSFDIPYDPLTNYLSPRPKFLRYRPNRRCEILVKSEEKSDGDSNSLKDSVESQVCDSAESSSEKENEEIVIRDEHVVVDEEDVDVDEVEEEGFEEGNWGLKWVLLKCLIVFFALFFCTISICSMSSSSVSRQELRGIKLEDEDVMNMSLRLVSLRSLDYGTWVLNESNRESIEAQEIEILEKLKFLDYYYQIQAQLKNEDYFRDGQVEFEVDNVGDDENGVLDSMTEYEQVEIESPMDASELSEGLVMEDLVGLLDLEAKIHDSEAKFSGTELESGVENATGESYKAIEDENWVPVSTTEHEQVEMEAPMLAKESNEGPRMEDVVGLLGSEAVIHDSEAKFSGIELESEVENATKDSDNAIEEEIKADSDKVMENSEAKSKEEQLANDHKEEQSESVESEPKIKKDQSETVAINASEDFFESEQLRLQFSDKIWLVISPLIALTLLSSLIWKFYCKCKRASSKTRSSNVKLCSNVGKSAKSRHGLPPKAVEKTDHYQLNAPSVQKADHSEVNPPLSINPQDNLESSLHTIIPKVKKLGEFEVGVEFTQSLKSCSMNTEIEQRDETMYSTPDITKRVIRRSSVSGRATTIQPSSSELSTAESYSHGSYISQDRISVKDGKEEVTKVSYTKEVDSTAQQRGDISMTKVAPTPRRSTRLRNKGVTSP